MVKQIVITITDDPASDSCDVVVSMTPEMDKRTFNKMLFTSPYHIIRIMKEGWAKMAGLKRESNNSIYKLFGKGKEVICGRN